MHQSVYMKSLMFRSSRAFLGGGGFRGLWATPGDICRHIQFKRSSVSECLQTYILEGVGYRRSRGCSSCRKAWPNHRHHRSSDPRCPGLTQEQEEKKTVRHNLCCLRGVGGTPTGVIVHHFPIMSRLIQGHYWTGLVVLPCRRRGDSP